ncbi:MAG TPA: VirB3 family type IV secretion system protein [Gammaproteobacteria bacterium]|nr:VirB3 family type IV secretion system protein [Gammaproteobacteria bacterium]
MKQPITTPVVLALTRRATLFGLPYNAFIILLMAAYVAAIWVNHLGVVMAMVIGIYIYLARLCSRDLWALDIFFMRLQNLGVYPQALKRYWGRRSYSPE